MRLISATIRNYRIHRELYVEFDQHRTLIGGPNEAGKSSLVEAVHHALFMKARTGGDQNKRIRSTLHDGDPSVVVVFEIGGVRHELAKTFTGKPNAPVRLHRDGHPPLSGDAAEEEIHTICQVEPVAQGRGLTERLRTQWAHLWVWQGSAGDEPLGDAPDSSRVPTDKLRSYLGDTNVFQSQRDTQIAAAVATAVNDRFTQTGGPRTSSSLAAAVKERDDTTQELTDAETAIHVFDAALKTIESAKVKIAEWEQGLAAIQPDIAATQRRRAEVIRLNELIRTRRLEADTSTTSYEELALADERIRGLEAAIREIDARIAPARDDRDRAAVNAEAAVARQRAATTAFGEARQAQAIVSGRLDWLGACVQLKKHTIEHAGLGGRCDRIAAARAEADALRQAMNKLPAVSDEAITDLDALDRRLASAEATFNAIATRVEILASDVVVSLGDAPLSPGDTRTIGSDAELRIGDIATLMIRPGGGQGVEEAGRERESARLAHDAGITALGVTSFAEARKAHARRQSLTAELTSKEDTLEGLGGRLAEQELEALTASLMGLTENVARRKPEDADIPSDLTEAETRKQAAENEATDAQSCADAAEKEHAEATSHRDAADALSKVAADLLRENEIELGAKKAALQDLIQRHGDDRAGRLAELVRVRDENTKLLAEAQQAYEEQRPTDLERDTARLERAEKRLQEDRTQAEISRQAAEQTLRFEGNSDPQQRRAKAVVRKRLAVAKYEIESRQGKAYQLLAELFQNQQREVEEQFAKPLADRVTEYVSRILGQGTKAVVRYHNNTFQGLALVRADRRNVAEPFAQLSGGTREQVAAATRLAMAEILAEGHGGCLPVVFDDSFAHSDSNRIRAMQGVLDFAASRGIQVIVLSCTPNEYAGLGAKRIDLDAPAIVNGEP
jgi:DNA repair exonuclease SbcCD ATPase subunit